MGKASLGSFEQSDEFEQLREHPAVREIADRLASPELEPPWSRERARTGLFITFIRTQEARGLRQGRAALPNEPNALERAAWGEWDPREGLSAIEIARYQQGVLAAACGADWREFNKWLATDRIVLRPPRRVHFAFEEDWAGQRGIVVGDEVRWGGRPPIIRGGDRAERLEDALETVREAVQLWGETWAVDALWDLLAAIVSELAQKQISGSQLAECARPADRRNGRPAASA